MEKKSKNIKSLVKYKRLQKLFKINVENDQKKFENNLLNSKIKFRSSNIKNQKSQIEIRIFS